MKQSLLFTKRLELHLDVSNLVVMEMTHLFRDQPIYLHLHIFNKKLIWSFKQLIWKNHLSGTL